MANSDIVARELRVIAQKNLRGKHGSIQSQIPNFLATDFALGEDVSGDSIHRMLVAVSPMPDQVWRGFRDDIARLKRTFHRVIFDASQGSSGCSCATLLTCFFANRLHLTKNSQ